MSQQLQQLSAESKKMDAQIEAKSDDARCYMIYYMVYIERSQQRSTICQHTIVYYVYHLVNNGLRKLLMSPDLRFWMT